LELDPGWLRDAARARRQPLQFEIDEMNALLEAAAFGRDEDEQAAAARQLIDRVVRCYDIDVRHVNGPMTLDPDVARKAETVGGDRRVRLGSARLRGFGRAVASGFSERYWLQLREPVRRWNRQDVSRAETVATADRC